MRDPDLCRCAPAMQGETESAFAWLVKTVAPGAPVSFVPNPGNIGDAAINLACWRYLAEHFAEVEICQIGDTPTHLNIFLGGGGNLVEGLYSRVADFIIGLPPDARVHLFPSTVRGCANVLASRGSFRIVCREPTSYRHVRSLVPPDNVLLSHDAAFALGPWLRSLFADQIERFPDASARPFRRDRERAISDDGSLDIMAQYQSDWSDLAWAEKTVRLAASYLLGFSRVETDRLHCAIISTLLGRRTILRPNSYFKNAAVFEHSLSRFPNVEFNGDLGTGAAPR